MDSSRTRPGAKALLVAVAVAGLGLVGGGILLRSIRKAPAPTVTSPGPRIVDPRRFMDEGSATRQSPEQVFLESALRSEAKEPSKVDPEKVKAEAQRVFGGLRELFRRMKGLADALKKTNPERYAAELQALQAELAALMQASRGLLNESESALQELVAMLRAEGDPLIKERLALLFRFAPAASSTTVLAELAGSADAGDRRAAIQALTSLRSDEAVKVLLERASDDPDVDNRERAIVGLGKSVSQPSPRLKEAGDSAMAAIRSYTHPDFPAPIRAAAWDALSFVPRLNEADSKLMRESLHAEKDPFVRSAVENAARRHGSRMKAEADRPQRPR